MVSTLLKQRDIHFCPLHPDQQQAQTACQMLTDLDGIHDVQLLSATRLTVIYQLDHFSLDELEYLVTEVGFHLDNSLLLKLKRALYRYTEETERANQGCPKGQSNCTRDVFINRYQQLRHGCRDQRPDHWRNYR